MTAASDSGTAEPPAEGSRKVRFSTQVDEAVQDDVRATVAALQRLVGPQITLGAFTTEALRAAVQAAQDEHNEGKPFQVAHVSLPRGRRLGEGT